MFGPTIYSVSNIERNISIELRKAYFWSLIILINIILSFGQNATQTKNTTSQTTVQTPVQTTGQSSITTKVPLSTVPPFLSYKPPITPTLSPSKNPTDINLRICTASFSEPFIYCTCTTTPTTATLNYMYISVQFDSKLVKPPVYAIQCPYFETCSLQPSPPPKFLNNYIDNGVIGVTLYNSINSQATGSSSTTTGPFDIFFNEDKSYAVIGNFTKVPYYCVVLPGIVINETDDCLMTTVLTIPGNYTLYPSIQNTDYTGLYRTIFLSDNSSTNVNDVYIEEWIGVIPPQLATTLSKSTRTGPIHDLMPYSKQLPIYADMSPEEAAVQAAITSERFDLINTYELDIIHLSIQQTYYVIVLDTVSLSSVFNTNFLSYGIPCKNLQQYSMWETFSGPQFDFYNMLYTPDLGAYNYTIVLINSTLSDLQYQEEQFNAVQNYLDEAKARMKSLTGALGYAKLYKTNLEDKLNQTMAYARTLQNEIVNQSLVLAQNKRNVQNLKDNAVAIATANGEQLKNGLGTYLTMVSEMPPTLLALCDDQVSDIFANYNVSLNSITTTNYTLPNITGHFLTSGDFPVQSVQLPYPPRDRFKLFPSPISPVLFGVNVVVDILLVFGGTALLKLVPGLLDKNKQ